MVFRATGTGQNTPSSKNSTLMTEVLDQENLKRALAQVKRNKGAPGIDGMTVDQLGVYLKAHWPNIRAQLVTGTYRPQPVKRVEIPKPDGRKPLLGIPTVIDRFIQQPLAQVVKGTYRPQPVKRVEIPKPDGRKPLLGIPTVIDRFIQQPLAQVVQRQWEPHFHPHSNGFRPGRNAHQAMRYVQATIRQGYGWVVDIDLESFFDRVNHDRLMVRVRKHVDAPDVLNLINRFLKGGVQVAGQTQATTQGVPQG